MWKKILYSIQTFAYSLADFFFPRYCTCCHARLALTERFLCISCLSDLPRIYFTSWQDNDIARIFWGLVPIEKAASFFHYTHQSPYSHILFDLKYHNRPEIGRYMGRMMAEELSRKGFFKDISLIIPIPLSKQKERQRGYNQSFWIARGLSEITGLPVDTSSVARTVSNPSQTQLNKQQRQENVRNIFAVTHPENLKERHILLVDDVITTGSTMLSCAETIARVCPVRLSVISLAWAGDS